MKMLRNKNIPQMYYWLVVFCLSRVFISECRRTKRVIGGQEVACGMQLQVASLRNTTNSVHLCGATILSHNHAVTAAHCVHDEPKQYFIQLNNYCLRSQDVPKSPVLNIIKHDMYKTYSHVHDIAVLRIKLNFTNITSFNGILLPNSSFGISALFDKLRPVPVRDLNCTGKCTIYGYGYRDLENKGTTETLHSAEVKLISLDKCTSSLGPYLAPEPDSGMICAIGDGVDACQGDSGGPLICSNYIQGLSSYGLGCNISEKPGVYVSIGAHLKWIRNKMHEDY